MITREQLDELIGEFEDWRNDWSTEIACSKEESEDWNRGAIYAIEAAISELKERATFARMQGLIDSE